MNHDRSASNDGTLHETITRVERTPPAGQAAIELTALVIGLILMGIQLWLLTVALDLYLSGHTTDSWLLAVISGLVFLGGLLMLRVERQHTPRR